MINEDKKIEVKTEDGKILEGEILFTFEANGDDFVLYQINDEVFAAKIDEHKNLRQVEEDEWPLVEGIFNDYMDELEDEEDE